jgi:hypothetical protein
MKIGQFEVGDYVVKDMGGKRHLVFDCKNCVYGASLAEDRACMFHVLHALQEVDADLIVFAEVYERVYDEHETKMLTEISALIRRLENDSLWSYAHLGTPTPDCEALFGARHDAVVRITHDMLAFDPVMAYLTCLHELKTETEKMGQMGDQLRECNTVYLSTLTDIKKRFESTEMIARAKDVLQKLQKVPESREIYRTMFEAEIKPSFIGSRLLFGDDEELELLDDYTIGEANVQIFKHPNKTENLYFVNPPEYTLSPEKYFILTKTKEIVASYKPGKTSLSTVAKSRKYFERIYESTIHDIAQATKIPLTNDEARELAGIVARYTVGYGVLELLLQDKHLTDIYIDAPIGMKPIYVVHSEFGQCQTNIVYTGDEAESLVSKLRAMSGRPFDEAHPVLDYDLADSDARIAVIGTPLSPDGNAFAFRLHVVFHGHAQHFLLHSDYASARVFRAGVQAQLEVLGAAAIHDSGGAVHYPAWLFLQSGRPYRVCKQPLGSRAQVSETVARVPMRGLREPQHSRGHGRHAEIFYQRHVGKRHVDHGAHARAFELLSPCQAGNHAKAAKQHEHQRDPVGRLQLHPRDVCQSQCQL